VWNISSISTLTSTPYHYYPLNTPWDYQSGIGVIIAIFLNTLLANLFVLGRERERERVRESERSRRSFCSLLMDSIDRGIVLTTAGARTQNGMSQPTKLCPKELNDSHCWHQTLMLHLHKIQQFFCWNPAGK
jgi:hypothetical protein